MKKNSFKSFCPQVYQMNDLPNSCWHKHKGKSQNLKFAQRSFSLLISQHAYLDPSLLSSPGRLAVHQGQNE